MKLTDKYLLPIMDADENIKKTIMVIKHLLEGDKQKTTKSIDGLLNIVLTQKEINEGLNNDPDNLLF